ncbi:hypothetical protein [Acinetobacter piscicola]|uniref:hypothetical protein n=1 Tax=Acinetobacter piscicola TaxID=2006115 RepID=UPI00101FB2CE|nr:hypothetical protein [Acinetobacter piscicola]RYL27748.1 hypothetical protein EWP19_06015 [Acinetobacter piscicola]
MLNKEDLAHIRDYSFEVKCHEVKIFQEQGIELLGYGVIKINPHGTFYLEFICLEKKQITDESWSVTYPIDALDSSQKLYLKATSIKGITFESDGFSINLHALQLDQISEHYILLKEVHVSKPYTGKNIGLYIEANQQFHIPKNIINKTTSTLGNDSSSRNEALIELPNENLSIRIINLDEGHSFIKVEGDIDKDLILDSLTLYLGFCSGALLQPYCTVHITNEVRITTLYSVTKNHLHQRFISAIPNHFSDSQRMQWEYHFNFLRSCIKLHSENPSHFLSLYAQWSRVWLSFQSVQEITNLTLVTAIEGLLNDVFIPLFKELRVDQILEQDIANIKKIIKSLDIDSLYKQRLQNSISYLKEITATKALKFLSDDGILKNEEVKAWKKLRNDVAHPKVKEVDITETYLENENFLHCINLFNSLILQALSYSGPRTYYSVHTDEPKILSFNSKIIY